jgi:hypothetical protein
MSRQPTKPKQQPLPLDHPNWMPLADVHAPLCKRAGAPSLAAYDLRQKLAPGAVRCMARKLADPSKRRRVKPAFWTDYEIHGSGQYVRNLGQQRVRVFWAFFVWRPDVVRQWPGLLTGSTANDVTIEKQRGRPPRYTPAELTDMQREYRDYRRDHPDARVNEADTHLTNYSKRRFKKSPHPDTLRDAVRKPVDEADALLEK